MNIPAVKTAEALASRLGMHALARLGEGARPHDAGEARARDRARLLVREPVGAHERLRALRRYGEKRPATFVKRVLDRDGSVLEDHTDWRDPWAAARRAARRRRSPR